MKVSKQGGRTLAEHDAQLKAEGRYDAMVERLRQQEEERLKRSAEWRHAERPLVDALRAAGVEVESAWDLVNTSAPYPRALPILLEHLQRPYPGPVREGIARALGVPEARFGWDVLIDLYRREQDVRAKDGLAVAIAGAAGDEVIADVIALASDRRQGPSRLLLLYALARSKDPRSRKALEDLETDPDLTKEVKVILRRKKRRR